jgi:2-dehydropantoate 2-reductase
MGETQEWPRIAVVGAGAVGGYFGGMFARAGAPTVFIGRKHFADAVNLKGLVLDKLHGQERIRATATVEMSAVRDCPLILFCVKANNTSAAATQMAPFVRPDVTVAKRRRQCGSSSRCRERGGLASRRLRRGVGARIRSRETSRTR